MAILPPRVVWFRALTVTSCAIALLASVMWWLRESGTLVPIAGPYTSSVILWLILGFQIIAGVCLVLVPFRWCGSGWTSSAVWRWESVALPVLPWLSVLLGPLFALPLPSITLLLWTVGVAVIALALSMTQRSNATESRPSAWSITARAIALVAAGIAGVLSVAAAYFGLGLNMPVRAWSTTEDSSRVIIEEHLGFDGEVHEVRWRQDGLIYRGG